MAYSIMVQGTSSHVGKSVLCTALCRIFLQDGYRTAPFKAQNMALNSAVTSDGGEIGRAQAAQAEAAGVKATVHMNPILLKPKQDMHAQVIVLGSPLGDMSAREYRQDYLPRAEGVVRQSLELLKAEFEVLVIEGAGSPAEVNLKDRDIVNMKTAELADAPVLLAADIDRGGVFASLVGTLELLEPQEKGRVKGFIINKFRGDIDLLKPGLEFLEARTGIPVLGVVPYIHDHGIDEEDSVALADCDRNREGEAIQIAVLQLPRISNFTDIKPLFSLPDTRVHYVKQGEKIGDADVVIIPGTKNSILDLVYLREEGYENEILQLAGRGRQVIGICGGYQMLGQMLLDPLGTEAGTGSLPGLGLLPICTTYGSQKDTHQVKARVCRGAGFWAQLQGQTLHGYEIHTGQCQLPAGEGLLRIEERSGQRAEILDGMSTSDGRIWGTHIHGIFDNPNLLLVFINNLRQAKGLSLLQLNDLGVWRQEDNYDRLAAIVRDSLDMEMLYRIMNMERKQHGNDNPGSGGD